MTSEPAATRLRVHTQTCLYLDTPIYLHLTVLQDSAFVWVGNKGNEVLHNLAVVMPSPYGGLVPATTVLSKEVDEISKQLGQKLGRNIKLIIHVTRIHN